MLGLKFNHVSKRGHWWHIRVFEPYHRYTMREVSMNSTSLYETNLFSIKGFSCLFSHHSRIYFDLYETNLFSIKGFSCLFSHHSRIYWFLPEVTKCVSQQIGKKNKCIPEVCRRNHQEFKCFLSSFCVNYFLRYYLMIQHQHIMKRVNGAHEWVHWPYKLLTTAACINTGDKMKGSCTRAADWCPFVPRHS